VKGLVDKLGGHLFIILVCSMFTADKARDEDLEKLFGEYGKIDSAAIVKEPVSGISR